MSEPEPPPADQLMQEAAAWFARMRGPDAEASRAGFEAWLRRGALHRAAYNRAAEIFAMGKLLSEDPAPARGPAPRRRQATPLLASLLVLAGLCSLPFLLAPAREAPVADRPDVAGAGDVAALLFVTGPGETRLVRLADGSRISLGHDTAVEVRLGRAERRVDLRRGQARFEILGELRPFVVKAGGGKVTALGTLFDIALAPDRRVTVRLIEGLVEVDLPPPLAGDPAVSTRRLRAGETVSFVAGADRSSGGPRLRSGGAPAEADPSPAAAVRDYRDIMLADLLAAANRGASRPVLLADAATGRRRVSGRFRIDDTLLLAERLALLFDLTIEHRPSGEIVLSDP